MASTTAHSLSAVPMSTRLTLRCVGHRRQVNDTRREDDRRRQATAQAHQRRARPPMPPAAPSRRKTGQPQVIVGDDRALRPAAGRTRTGRRPDRAVPPARSASSAATAVSCSASAVGSERSRNTATVVEPTEIDGDRARIDAENARHRRQCTGVRSRTDRSRAGLDRISSNQGSASADRLATSAIVSASSTQIVLLEEPLRCTPCAPSS